MAREGNKRAAQLSIANNANAHSDSDSKVTSAASSSAKGSSAKYVVDEDCPDLADDKTIETRPGESSSKDDKSYRK